MKWDAQPLVTYPDGLFLLSLQTRGDLKQLGDYQGHCGGFHFPWVWAGSEYFFIICHADGTPGATVHAKDVRWVGIKHPIDETPEFAKWRSLVWRGSWAHIHSTYYDGMVDGQAAVEYGTRAEEEWLAAKIDYDRLKKAALKIGALGKDHPMKEVLDKANRRVSSCAEVVRAEKQARKVTRGRTFAFDGKNLVVLAVTARGFGYDGVNTKYTDKFHEFMGKEVEVEFGGATSNDAPSQRLPV